MLLRRAALCWLLLVSGDALADGVLRDAIGAVSAGRGGANLARADNGAVLHDNPAGILNTPGQSLFELRLDAYQFRIDYSDPENDDEDHVPLAVLPEFSYVRRSEDGRFAAGVGLFVPGGFGTRFRFTNPVLGRHEYESFAALAKLLPAAAYRVTENLSVGATLGVAFSRVELDAPYFVQTGSFAGTGALVDLAADGFAPVWSAGLQYDWGKTRIGVAYLSETRLDLDGELEADVFLPGGGIASSEFDLNLDFEWPRSLGLGIARPLGPHHHVSADIVWFDWSDAFDRFELELSDASNPAFAALREDIFPVDWWDGLSFRLGYEYLGLEWGVLRFGYVFHTNPIPDSNLIPLIPGNFEHVLSAGASRRAGAWLWSFALQLGFAPTVRVSSSDLVGGDFDASRLGGVFYGAFVSLAYSLVDESEP